MRQATDKELESMRWQDLAASEEINTLKAQIATLKNERGMRESDNTYFDTSLQVEMNRDWEVLESKAKIDVKANSEGHISFDLSMSQKTD